MTQRFDKFGKRYSTPKILQNLTYCSTEGKHSLDALSLKMNEDLFVVSVKCNLQTTLLTIYDFNENSISSVSVYTYGGTNIFLINQKYQNNLVKLVQLEKMKLGVISIVQQGDVPILQLVIVPLYVDGSFKLNFQREQNVQLLTYSQFKAAQYIDIQLIDNEIKAINKNDPINSYLLSSFDIFGVMLNQNIIRKSKNQIEFKIISLNSNSYLTVWTTISSFNYEVFCQISQKDGITLTSPQKLSTGGEIYKLDLQINILANTILITWREGSQFSDISLNSVYKGALISKQSYQLIGEIFQINSANSQLKSLGRLEVIELQNQDMIISIMFYNILVDTQIIISYKFNEMGERLEFSQMRCGYACQECNQQGLCFKCTNSDLYLLQMDGSCVKKPEYCVNFKTYCQDCLDGYYKTQYLTCEKINQQVEKTILFDYEKYYYFYQIASYSNGNFVVVGSKSYTIIELNYYLSDGTQKVQNLQIITISNSNRMINDISLTIDDNNLLTIFYSVFSYTYSDKNMYYYQQFDQTFNKLAEAKLFYLGLQNQETTSIKAKILNSGQYAIIIKSRFDIYLQIMKLNFEFVADIKLPFSDNFDFTSNGELIAFAYIKDTICILNIFDLQLKLIQHQIINDGGLVKLASNELKQFIIVTNNQINIFAQGLIKQSYNITAISDINEIVIHSYQKNSKSYHLYYFSMQGLLKKSVQVNMNYTDLPTQNSWLTKLQNNNFIVFFHAGIINYNWRINFARFDQQGVSRPVVYPAKHLLYVIFVVLASKRILRLYFAKKYVSKLIVTDANLVIATNARVDFNLMNWDNV
ncbi:unnamed protein product (macronuclear) [Paramecium tetraurelia]|uniref:Transmembrane protein n=1 Tax=Paramecium tetraurelia TaxID=5888 RepID=A0CQ01_PARTE|nr:uncharacterized protein GSPATT00038825001 [Paramecium tetraurelia]CAK72868.1 unnamed protein product [Paramecium tetraurelia]|eukprot:XP_001440265.1 hypothetical protein (macronuclear) [Paramecium tetraurelia strain d4-2]